MRLNTLKRETETSDGDLGDRKFYRETVWGKFGKSRTKFSSVSWSKFWNFSHTFYGTQHRALCAWNIYYDREEREVI